VEDEEEEEEEVEEEEEALEQELCSPVRKLSSSWEWKLTSCPP